MGGEGREHPPKEILRLQALTVAESQVGNSDAYIELYERRGF
jgi:hypothetical protein